MGKGLQHAHVPADAFDDFCPHQERKEGSARAAAWITTDVAFTRRDDDRRPRDFPGQRGGRGTRPTASLAALEEVDCEIARSVRNAAEDERLGARGLQFPVAAKVDVEPVREQLVDDEVRSKHEVARSRL